MDRRVTYSSKENSQRGRAWKPAAYPFSAIVGQEEMKLALLLNAIDARVGGVLIMGHRGTGKSTAVRALADLLPEMWRVRGCSYGCDPADESLLCEDCSKRLSSGERLARERVPVPVVDLPLGATEDRVCGTIDVGRALSEGIKAFEPGLLARANRGFLYIDEVNLLEDHLIDLLLDVSQTGVSQVEREGVSVEHPSRFVLVGSGNPEEGELRPQLLDRFGLHVEVKTAADLDERVLIVERREAFERDSAGFRAELRGEQERLKRRVTRARKGLDSVILPRAILLRIAELCQELKVDGHRGELTVARAARALAALEGRKEVSEKDVKRVAVMALRHRLRRDPLEQTSGGSRVEKRLDNIFPQEPDEGEHLAAEREPGNEVPPTEPAPGEDRQKSSGGAIDGGALRDAPATVDARVPDEALSAVSHKRTVKTEAPVAARMQGAMSKGRFNSRRGRYVSSSPIKADGARIALYATLLATVSSSVESLQTRAGKKTDPRASTPDPHLSLRYKRLKHKEGTLFVFAVDTSGSMALNRIAQAKGALVRLLQRSYVSRDRVALVTFRGESAEQVLKPSSSVTRARGLLERLCVGGATPLGAGLAAALDIITGARKQGAGRIVLLVFTDGRANVPLGAHACLDARARRRLIEDELGHLGRALKKSCAETVVVDTQNRFLSGGDGRRLAELIGARHLELEGAGGEVL